MKLAGFFLIFLFSLAILSSFAAGHEGDLKEQFDHIATYAQDYESGKISYLQLKVLAESIGEKIRRSVSEGFIKVKPEEAEHEFEGLSTAAIEQLLGPSTEKTSHVWIVNEEKSAGFDKELPGWRKTIFNGNKIKITVNAWPQIFRSAEGDLVFYWMGFEFFFKKQFELDPNELAAGAKQQAENYYYSGQGAEIVAKNLLTTEKILRDYLEQNSEDCENAVKSIVDGERSEKLNRQTRGSLFSGKNIKVKIDSGSCVDCKDWSDFHIGGWVEAFDRSYNVRESEPFEFIRETYRQKSLEELYSTLEKLFSQMKQSAQTYDNTKYQQFSDEFAEFRGELDVVSQAINEKVNDWQLSKEERAKQVKARDERAEKIFDKFLTEKTSEVMKQVEFRKKLLTFNETKTGTHCETKYEDCGPAGMCTGGPRCIARPEEERRGPPEGEGRICPAVCVPMWENRNGNCEFNQCGSGCGADNQNTFNTEAECRSRIQPAATATTSVQATSTTLTNETLGATTTSAGATTTQQTTTTAQATTTTSAATTTTAGPTGGFLARARFITGYQIAAEDENSCLKKGCRQNQFCNSEKGWCECNQGSSDCDGDWRNGCESQQQCAPCNPGAECSPARCEPEHMSGIERFTCVQDEARQEEVAGFEMNANCQFGQSEQPHGWVGFNGWGEKFDRINQLKQSGEGSDEWCSRELSSLLKERREMEKSFESGFLDWFMKDYIPENAADFEIFGRTFGSLYWSIVENNKRVAESLTCLGREAWPETDLITERLETDYGGIYIYEKFVETDHFGERMRVLSPYMVMNIFPPKEVFKKFFIQGLKEGRIGPEGEEENGPSPAEIAQIKREPEAYDIIKRISNNFGGEANIIFSIKDKGVEEAKMLMQVNPEIIMQMKPALDYKGEVDATLSIDFDYFYSMISSMEKGKSVHTESPPWDEVPRIDEAIGGAAEGIKFFTGIIGGIVTGKITVSPVGAWVSVISSFGDLLKMMSMGG